MSRAARTVSDSMTADSSGMYLRPPGSGMSMNSLRIGGTPFGDEQADRNSARTAAAVATDLCLMAPTLTTATAAPQAFCVGASIAGPPRRLALRYADGILAAAPGAIGSGAR